MTLRRLLKGGNKKMEEKDFKIGMKLKAGRFQVTEFIRDKQGKDGSSFKSSDYNVQKSWLKKDGNSKNKEDWESQRLSLFDLREIRQLITILEELERKIILD